MSSVKRRFDPTKALPRAAGTTFVGDTDVPLYRPLVGQSVAEAAQALGLRILGRREAGEAVAAIGNPGELPARCVKATS
jgi:hypothetical protein